MADAIAGLDGQRPEGGTRWRHAPAVGGYALLTMAVMWPAVAHFRTRPMVNGGDGAVFSWLWWEMPRAVGHGSNPYTTELLFHPVGADLALTTSAPLVGLVTWPVQVAFGPTAQINLVQLASMLLAGWAMYRLAEAVCRNRGAAFVAGAAFAMLPARFVHVDGHLNLVETAVLPFGLLVFLRFSEAPTTRGAIKAGAVMGASFLIDPQLALLLGLGVSVLTLERRHSLMEHVHRLVGGALVALVVASPLLLPMGVALGTGGRVNADSTSDTIAFSASPLSWLVPPLDRLRIGHLLAVEPVMPTAEGVAHPGLLMLALAVVGTAVTSRDRRRGWVAMAMVGFILSLGPYPLFGDRYLELPLPFSLFRLIPGLDAVRVPGRFALLGGLAVQVLAASALADMARRIPRRAPLVVGIAALVTVAELWPRSLPSRPNDVPTPYERIAEQPDDGAVLEIPLKWSTGHDSYGFDGHQPNFMFLLYAMEHEHPLVSGAVSRYPDADLHEMLSVPSYRQLLALGGEPGFDDQATFDRRDLEALGIGYVVYHRDDPVPAALAYLQQLDLPVLADDGNVIVWRVRG
jgi:hypothetical protein